MFVESNTAKYLDRRPPLAKRAPGCNTRHDRRAPAPRLRRQARDRPARRRRGVARIEQAVVQPRRAPLPELDRVGHEAVAAPVRRARRVVAVAFADGLFPRFERRAAVDHGALVGRPCADARAERARREIAVAFFRTGFLDPAFDAHLAFELDPVEQQRGLRMHGEIVPLAAFVIGEKDEPALVDALDEHDPRRRPAVGADGRERHRVRLGQLGGERLLEPAIELGERVGGGIGFVERSA